MPPPPPPSAMAKELTEPLVRRFFRNDRFDLTRQINTLKELNEAFGGSPWGYLFAGRDFSTFDKKVRVKNGILFLPDLDPSLKAKGEVAFLLQERIEREETLLSQSLSVVLGRCQSRQEVRNALPDEMAEMVPELRRHRRTKPYEQCFPDEPLLQLQQEQIFNLVFDRLGNKLLGL